MGAWPLGRFVTIRISLVIRLLRRMLHRNEHLYLVLLTSKFRNLLSIPIAMRLIIETISRISPRKLYDLALSRGDGRRFIERRCEPFLEFTTAACIKADNIQPSVGDVGLGG